MHDKAFLQISVLRNITALQEKVPLKIMNSVDSRNLNISKYLRLILFLHCHDRCLISHGKVIMLRYMKKDLERAELFINFM